ncbi:MAG TPA: hypothetical protein VI670_16510 [Thermoanaerobaculia bacterium]|jgi:hypothetical protein
MPEPHADRRSGLVFFGALQILLGLLAFLLLLRTAATARVNVAQSLFFISVASFYLVVTGIGSIRGRRWARALIAAISGAWTVLGVFGFALVLTVFRRTPSIGILAILAIALIALPLVLTLFYSSRDTALTADELDPKLRWTDRAPVPVLAICAVLAFSSVETLINSGKETFSFFGQPLAGAPAALAMIAFGILFAHVAIQAYRLRESAWWVLLLLHVIGGVTSATALPRSATLLQRPALWVAIAAGWLAYLGFLIYVRRYFGLRAERVPAPVVLSTST